MLLITFAHVDHVRKNKFDVYIEYVATPAHVVNVCKHKLDATFMEYVATLANAVNVCKHKFNVTLIGYVVTLCTYTNT
jgi:hypothetical protein